MAYIDESAREINVKVVWYSPVPGRASGLVRYIGDRTRPDLKKQTVLPIEHGMTVTCLQFVPAAAGTLRGYSTRFHLFAIDSDSGGLETDAGTLLLFKGADACVFVGGPGDQAALERVKQAFASHGYSNIPLTFLGEDAARGPALGFPPADCFAFDTQTGTGVFDAFKAIARKILMLLTGK